jgi:glycine/D-amino acid oxidase-like deaminating enzyme
MPATYDVAIAGAGIVGAACALECAAAGLKVVVVDAGPIGGGATAAGMGHIVVMDDSPAQAALTRYSRALWMELAPELPDAAEYTTSGTLWIAAGEDQLAEVERKRAAYQSLGVRCEALGPGELSEAEPQLRQGLSGALRVPDDAVLYAPCAALYLMNRARERGAEVRLGTAVRELAGGRMELDGGTTLSAGVAVNAAGSWAPQLTPGIPVRRRKGHLVITDRYPRWPVRHQLVELGYLRSAHSLKSDSVAFNIQPRRTGQLLIGSSRQYGAEHSGIDAPILGAMLRRAQEYMPGLADLAAIRSWTGFRAATPDNLPLIGPRLWDRRLFLATGHEGLGITTSLATGRLVADQILGRAPAIPVEPYLPDRGIPGHA